MKPPSSLRQMLERLDRVCGLMNDWLLVVALGLFVVDLMLLIACLAPPTTVHSSAFERTQDGKSTPTYQGVP